MPLSKSKQAEWMRLYRRQKKKEKMRADALVVTGIMSSADVRAMRKAGIKPEDVESESGKVSSRVHYALLRDRDAIKAHLSWHHDQIGKPDIGTIVEQLQARVTLLEAEQVLHEARETYWWDAGAALR